MRDTASTEGVREGLDIAVQALALLMAKANIEHGLEGLHARARGPEQDDPFTDPEEEEQRRFIISPEAMARFKALMVNPPKPNEALKGAMAKYHEAIANGDLQVEPQIFSGNRKLTKDEIALLRNGQTVAV